MRVCKRLMIVVSCFMLCLSSSISVHASTGSLVYKLEDSFDVANIQVYRVADFVEDSYSLVPEFSDCMSKQERDDFSKMSSDSVLALDVQQNAECLVRIVEEYNIDSYYSSKIEGSFALYDLPLGMYLIVGEMSDSTKVLLPSLIGIPFKEDGMFIYDVVAHAKVGMKPNPGGNTSSQTHMYTYLGVLTLSAFGLFLLLRKEHEA